MQFLTYLGGKTDDGALGITVDQTGGGAIWITGFTDSTNFPTHNAMRTLPTGQNKNAQKIFPVDAFITKLDPTGVNLLFSTYFGAEGLDEGVGITTDASGSVYLTGFTSSLLLPVTPPNVFQPTCHGDFDAFVTKLVSTGDNTYTNVAANSYTTYLGGTNTEYGLSIAVDSSLDAWVTGITYSTNFYTTNALQLAAGINEFFPDGYTFTNLNTETNNAKHNNTFRSDAFVTEISADGLTVPFSTYLGGSNDDAGERIVINNAGDVYVGGYTLSRNFPTNIITLPTTNTFGMTNVVFPGLATNFSAHAFVTQITGGALGHSTHFGGNSIDLGLSMAVDDNGLIYVIGSAGSTNLFVTNMLVYTNTSLVVDKHGNTNIVYLGTFTNNPVFTNLSSTNITVKFKHGANTNDVFVAVLTPGLETFVQSIIVGGPAEDDPHGIAVDHAGTAVYIVGSTTSKTNFVTTNAAQSALGGVKNSRLADGFVGKIQIVPSP